MPRASESFRAWAARHGLHNSINYIRPTKPGWAKWEFLLALFPGYHTGDGVPRYQRPFSFGPLPAAMECPPLCVVRNAKTPRLMGCLRAHTNVTDPFITYYAGTFVKLPSVARWNTGRVVWSSIAWREKVVLISSVHPVGYIRTHPHVQLRTVSARVCFFFFK